MSQQIGPKPTFGGGDMAVPAAQGELWQLFIQGRIENQQCENVLWFRADTAVEDMIVHLLNVVLSCFVSNVLPVLSTTYTFERIRARRVFPSLGPDIDVVPEEGTILSGQAAGDAEPSFVSALISLRSSRGGRSGRGRMFIAGVPEGSTTASYLNVEAGLYVALLAFCVCMITGFTVGDPPAANSVSWGVFSRKLGGLKFPYSAAGYAPIISATPIRELATTRSRKIGHGH